MITLIIVKNPFSPQDGREVRRIEYAGTIGELKKEYTLENVDLLATVNGYGCDDEKIVTDGDFVVIYPSIQKGGGKGGKGILGIIAAIALSVVAMGVGGLVATGTWGSFAGASALAATGGYLAAAAIMFLGSSLIGRMNGSSADTGSYGSNEATYAWSGVQTMEGQNNPIALTYGMVKSGGQTIGKYTMSQGDDDYLYWLIAAGEGELEISDIKLNDNAIGLFDGVISEIRYGTNDQEPISFFGDTHFTKILAYTMELDTWYTSTAQGTATEGLTFKIECSSGLFHTNSSGEMKENTVAIQLQMQKMTNGEINNAAWVDITSRVSNPQDYDESLNALVIKGSSNKAIRKEYRIDRISAGEYAARVRIIQIQHHDSSRDMYATYWTGLSSIVYDDFIYPNIALIGIKAKATGQLSGSPTLSFRKWRTFVWVWNPNRNAYETEHASNPAWACYDLIHQACYLKNINTGNYEYEVRGAAKELMRYDDFKAWADYCDEKNYYVDIEIVVAGEMLEVANQKIAPIGHGIVVRFGTKYGCIYAHPQEAVQMFGMGNICEGTFREEFMKVADRANCVEVTFTNAEADYARDVITIYSDTYDADGYAKTAQVTLDGVTSYTQAYREGIYQLLCNKYQLRTVSFEAGIDSIACTVGDVVIINHDVPQWKSSGRVYSVDGADCVLPCRIEEEEEYYIIQWRAEATDVLYSRRCSIVDAGDEWTIINIITGQGEDAVYPSEGDIFSLAVTGTENQLFTVQSITRAQDFTRQISCIEYNEAVFQEAENYDPNHEKQTQFNVTILQSAYQTITVRAFKGVASESHTESFGKDETGWSIEASITCSPGYAYGRMYVNGVRYEPGTVLTLNKDYTITATAADVGAVVYTNGTIGWWSFGWDPSHWRFYSDVACTTEISKNDLTGRLVVRNNYTESAGGRIRGQHMFGSDNYVIAAGCRFVTEIVQNIATDNMTMMEGAFVDCTALVKVDLSDWNVSSCTDLRNFFSHCSALLDFGDISDWNTVSLTDASSMFESCSSVVSIDLSGWTTASLTNVGSMFFRCDALKAIDISGWDTTNITNTGNFVGSCPSLRYVIMNANEIKFSGSVSMPDANSNVKYLVPANMVDSYRAHPNWSGRASRIVSIDNYNVIHSNGHVDVMERGD